MNKIKKLIIKTKRKNHKIINMFKHKNKLFKLFSIIIFLLVISTITIIILAEFKLIKLPWLDYPEVLTLSQNEITLKKDSTFQFTTHVYPSQVNYGRIIYESSDTTVADINPITGYVTTKKNGVVSIKAYLEDYHDVLDTCELVVASNDVLVESINLSQNNIDLLVGNTHLLKYEYYPKDAGLHNFSYSSSDPEIIKVNYNGEVTALKPGKAVINIIEEVSGQSVQQEFTVYKKNIKNDEKYIVSSIKLSTNKLNLNVQGEYQATATVYPEDVNQTISWSSIDPNIATVTDNGLIKALDYGQTKIIATAIDGTNKIIELNVQEEEIPVTKINADNINITIDNSKKINATIEPKNATNQSIIFSSDDESIATVNKNGEVYGTSKGNTIITLTDADEKVVTKIKVSVIEDKNSVPVSNIKLSTTAVTIDAGSSVTVNATVIPNNATKKNITWSSENTNIATVSNGMIYGKAPGTTNIVVRANQVYRKIAVLVKPIPVKSVRLNENNVKLGIGAETKLYAIFTPSNATNKNISWMSSNNNIATVNSSGLVTAKSKGQATIIATASNGQLAKCTITVTNEKIQVSSLTLSSSQYTVKVNEKVAITPIITPSNATNQRIKITSSNSNIASVQSDGSIKGIKEGIVQITAKTDNGKVASAFVIVKNKKASVNYLDGKTIKYWYDNTYGTYAITHIWVKDAYNQFKVEIPNKFGSLASPNTLAQKAARKNSSKTLIAINGSGFVNEEFTSKLYKVNKAWKNTSASPIVINEGKLLRDYTTYDLPIDYVRIYGMNKKGELTYYKYSNNKNNNTSLANNIINDGVKYTFGWFPVLVSNNKVTTGLSKSNNIRQGICQIDKYNFLYISNITTNRSKGFSHNSLAEKMVELGCKTGFNLDGGGSTSIYYVKKGSVNPTKIKTLEGGQGRSIPDILYFVGD